jgi:DNA-binding NtrC family response regulator
MLDAPEKSSEAWFPLVARLRAASPDGFVPWLEALEAEREVSGGRVPEARVRLERVLRSSAASAEERRAAGLRLAELAVALGQAGEGALRAAAWRRENPNAPADEMARALRLGAFGLAREGRFDCALALLDDAERVGASLPAAERVETALSRARVHALAGRFDEEEAVYESVRSLALGSGDEIVAGRFLAQEGRRLLDRRENARAILRLEEALALFRDDPAEEAGLLLDLAATHYHAGDPARSEALLTQSLEAAAAAGREDLARIARGNRIELRINRCAWEIAAAEIAALEASARSDRDDSRLLVALHHRSRLALRRGLLAPAAADNARARELAARLSDRLEIGELWLEEGDRRLYEGDTPGAREAWERAAEDPPDRCASDAAARDRLRELAALSRDGPSEEARAELDALFARDAYRGAETVARWRCILGAESLSRDLRERAEIALRDGGGEALADRVFGDGTPAVRNEALRGLRHAISAAMSGGEPDGHRALGLLGIAGLAVRDAGGREVARLGTPAPDAEPEWRELVAGSARFELALWPPASAQAADSIAMILETLLFRPPAASAPSDFAEGWSKLGITTADPSMEEPYRRLGRFAPQPVTVLILGASGCGKEAVARAVHRLSPRTSGPFVAVNVPAIPAALLESELFGHARGSFTGADRDRRGLLEEAAGGTIFFDEIGDLPLPLQSKLLRALQEKEIRRVGENRARPIDARVVSATSRDLAERVESGQFREDLFYRLHVAVIRLPPLRERGRDAAVLARCFLERFAREYGRGALRLTPEAAAAIAAYPWPGNVRELQNAIAQAAALCDADGSVEMALLPERVRGRNGRGEASGDYRSRVDSHRRELIAGALDRAGGNRSRAARELGLSRQALHYLIRELGVPAGRKSGSP